MMTVSAVARLMPTPPARVDSRNTGNAAGCRGTQQEDQISSQQGMGSEHEERGRLRGMWVWVDEMHAVMPARGVMV